MGYTDRRAEREREDRGWREAAAYGHDAFSAQPQPVPAHATAEASSRSMRVSEVGGDKGLAVLARAMELIKDDEIKSALHVIQKGF